MNVVHKEDLVFMIHKVMYSKALCSSNIRLMKNYTHNDSTTHNMDKVTCERCKSTYGMKMLKDLS